MKTMQYTYKYKPAIYDYIMKSFIFDEHKKEREIFELLVKGKTCDEIANEIGYSPTTIKRRRKYLYDITRDLMI